MLAAWGKGKIEYNVRRNGKIDIALSYNDHTPFAIVEVRVASAPNAVWEDAQRIYGILGRNNGIQHGMLAIIISGQSEINLVFRQIESRSLRSVSRITYIPDYVSECDVTPMVRCPKVTEDDREYAAMAFTISCR